MKDLRITLVQSHIGWENIEGNLIHLESMIRNVKTDLVIFPEMFTTGFSMNTSMAETMDGTAVSWMRRVASEMNCVLAGSLMIREDGKFFNRFIWMRPDGSYEYYNKRHLFRMAKEDEHYTAGYSKKIVELNGWKINLQVCYDLRFPVWSRNVFREGKAEYDLLIYVANWPERRRGPWSALLPARAIENLCYVAGVNRVGEDGNNIPYSGDSVAIDFKGDVLSELKPSQEGSQTISLSYDQLQKFRDTFPAWMDADRFTIEP